MMNRRTFAIVPLLLVVMALCLATPPGGAQPATGIERLTHGAQLHLLEAWPEETTLLARDNNRTLQEVDAGSGNVRPSTIPVTDLDHPRLSISVEFTTHKILLDGEEVVTLEDDIVGGVALSPDGAWLVAVRYPRGNETAALGEVWRYDIVPGRWFPLTANQVEEVSPVISPDGRRVAFLHEGDIWTIAASDTTTGAPEGAAPEPEMEVDRLSPDGRLEPPATIRVKHDAARNTCRPGVPDGRIDVIPLEEYVKRVTPHESPPSWHMETLKAQAVAARSYGWRQMLEAPADQPYDVTDSTAYQYMCDTTHPNTNAAVDATTGQYLQYLDKPILAMFSAENSSPTRDGNFYLDGVDDPISFGHPRRGHGFGFSQWGGKRWADSGWSYRQILLHYYPGATLEPANSDTMNTLLDVGNRPPTNDLRGAGLSLEMNAFNVTGTRAREWLQWEPDGPWDLGGWQDDMQGEDGWRHFFDLRALPEVPQGRYRIEYAPFSTRRGATSEGPPLPVLYLGIDRTPPELSRTLSTSEPDGTSGQSMVTISLSATDGNSGVERIGWAREAWGREAETVGVGTVIADPAASGGLALRLEPGAHSPHPFAFPFVPVTSAHYRVWFRARTDNPLTTTRIATLRLFDDAETPLQRGVRHLHAYEFPDGGWHWFYVDVDATAAYVNQDPYTPPYAASGITPVIEWYGTQRLEIDRYFLAIRADGPSGIFTSDVTPGEAITVYASDRAGNVTVATCFLPTPPSSMAHRLFLPVVAGGNLFPGTTCESG